MESFIDDLIKEAEEKAEMRTAAYYDILLLEIGNLQDRIADNFSEVEKEIELINRFALSRNATIQNKIDWLSKKLEAYIKEKGEKTIDMPHGTLKMHKRQDKIEITDLDLFLKHAKKEMLSIVPEQWKPDLTKIKSFVKMGSVPKGVNVIGGDVEFSYKIKKDGENGRQEEIGIIGVESASDNGAKVRLSA